MQLFYTHYTLIGKEVVINDSRVLHQCKNVLRYLPGEHITICVPHTFQRIEIEITQLTKQELKAICREKFEYTAQKNPKTILCAMPNKHEKIELIVQKCTEIGVDHIVFFPSHRSQLKEISPAKQNRLSLISLEAAEQSRSRTLPTITILPKLQTADLIGAYVCHGDANAHSVLGSDMTIHKLLIGPEGGRSPEEITFFRDQNLPFISLGDTILRTETAAIVGGRLLKNNS